MHHDFVGHMPTLACKGILNGMHHTLGTHFKQTLRLSIPLVVGQLGQMMMGVVDSLMVGHIGAAPLAASALGNNLFFLVFVFGLGLSLAISPMVARRLGANRPGECGKVLGQAVQVCLVVGLLLAGLVFVLAGWIPRLGQPPDVAALAIPYTRIIGLSAVPFLIFMAYKQFSEGLSVTRPAMLVAIVANGFNAFFNWIFIFGHWGFEAYGLNGAGWSTLLTRSLMALALVGYVMISRRFRPFKPGSGILRWHADAVNEMLKIGIPSGMQYFLEVFAFVASAFLIGGIGKNPLAAHQIAINLASITYMFALGVAMAAAIRVARFRGMEDWIGVRTAGYAAFLLVLSVMGFNALVFTVFHRALPWLYISDPAVVRIASGLLVLAALFQLSDGVQAVGLGILRGLSDVTVPTRLVLIAYWGLGLPLGCLLAYPGHLGVYGLWVGFVMGLTSLALMLAVRFWRLTHNRTIPSACNRDPKQP